MTTPEATAQNVLDFCRQHDQFAGASGIELIEVEPGRAKARMTIGQRQLNSLGTVHGGALFTLAATAFFAACNSHGQTAMGTNMNIACLRPAREGVLLAEAVEESRSRRLAHCTVSISDENRELIARFHGTAYIKHDAFPGPR